MNLDLTDIKLPEIKAGIDSKVYVNLGITVVAIVLVSSIMFFLVKKAFA